MTLNLPTKSYQGHEWISLNRAAVVAGKGTNTIKIYYEHAERTGRLAELPEFTFDIDRRSTETKGNGQGVTKYLRVDQLGRFKTFGDTLQRGELADLTKAKYGSRNEYQKEWQQEQRDKAKEAKEAEETAAAEAQAKKEAAAAKRKATLEAKKKAKDNAPAE